MMKKALDSINEKILAAVQRRQPGILAPSQSPRLVAVSKLKPSSDIIEAYECGQRHFGENYIQELVSKSNSPEILEKCPDIKFHFIGQLQSNKVSKLLKVKNLSTVETVDSEKLADLINKAIERQHAGERTAPSGEEGDQITDKPDRSAGPLKVLIQVNTSGEDQKNGIQPTEAPQLAEHIVEHCKHLSLTGIMTIGKFEGWDGPNQDFIRLYEVRKSVSEKLSVDPLSLELSMGMSGDFEEAIRMGSTNVRVGTLIFGERSKKQAS